MHRFEACDVADAFPHPHPWPSAVLILSGEYEMRVSQSADLESGDHLPTIRLTLGAGSTYHMDEPTTWHQVIPRSRCYSLMVNGQRWERPHRRAPSTSGKGLQPMSEEELSSHLATLGRLLDSSSGERGRVTKEALIDVSTDTDRSYL
ncbi:MAG: hypothetical protein AAFU85_25855 [Planctomycetota bacterium]